MGFEEDVQTAREDARTLAGKAVERKGIDPLVLDISKASDLFHCMVIVTAMSRRHARTLAGEIEKEAENRGMFRLGVEGADEARWVLIDLVDVVVHIFLPEVREYYSIENLWADAEEVPLPPSP